MSEWTYDPVLYPTRPDSEGRLPKEMRVYDVLEKLNIPFVRVDHEVTPSMESCQVIDELLKTSMCKNLFLCNSQKTAFYLLLMPGEKNFRTKDLSKQIGSARLSFGTPEYLEAYLDLTPGSVSVFGLLNDPEQKVRLLIDEEILKDEYLGFHPCINTSSLRVATKDLLEKFLPYTGHTYTAVQL